jgi:uncharacterized membrane protein YjjP (DUF1212 family)
MKQKKISPFKKAALWVCVLPASLLGASIVHGLYALMQHLTEGEFNILHKIMASGLYGAAFVYIGYLVAPAHKNITATVLAGIVLFFSGMLLTGMLDDSMTLGIVATLFMNVGSIAICCNAWHENLNSL